jgi:hypothetical protein
MRRSRTRTGGEWGHNEGVQLPRFWIAMQIVIVVCVLISAVIVLIKL